MDIQNAYNEWSDIYDTNANLTRDLNSRVTRSLLASRRFDSILELGCGTGKNTVFFAEIGRRVHTLDFSQGMIEKAREKVKAGNVRFEAADLTKRWNCLRRTPTTSSPATSSWNTSKTCSTSSPKPRGR